MAFFHRWRFHQQGDLQKNVNFVAKVAYISIVGVAHGSARNCTPCPPGYYSSDGASKCKPCPPGQYSGGGTRNCSRCQGNNYTDVVSVLLVFTNKFCHSLHTKQTNANVGDGLFVPLIYLFCAIAMW